MLIPGIEMKRFIFRCCLGKIGPWSEHCNAGGREFDSGQTNTQGPFVRKPINANPRLKINQGVYFPTPKCCSTLILGKTLQ